MNITSSNFFMTGKMPNNSNRIKHEKPVATNNNSIKTPETVDNTDFDISKDDLKSLFDGIFNMISTNKTNGATGGTTSTSTDGTTSTSSTGEATSTEETKEATDEEKAKFEQDCKALATNR